METNGNTSVTRRRRRWLRRLPGLLLELFLLAAIVFALEWWLTRDAVRGPAPMFTATTLEGTRFSLAELAGRPALVHFWATWCPVCELEHASIEALAREAHVVTVAMQSGGRDEVEDYLQERAVSLPVVLDESGLVARSYGVHGVPASFVLNAAGEVVFVTRGYTTGPGLRLRLWAAQWL